MNFVVNKIQTITNAECYVASRVKITCTFMFINAQKKRNTKKERPITIVCVFIYNHCELRMFWVWL